jgi:hypothetical protein
MNIKQVDTLGAGDPVSRRRFLESLGVNAVAGIAALQMTGRSEGNVGVESDRFTNHPFKAIGGYVDNGKLLLPSGYRLVSTATRLSIPLRFTGHHLKD